MSLIEFVCKDHPIGVLGCYRVVWGWGGVQRTGDYSKNNNSDKTESRRISWTFMVVFESERRGKKRNKIGWKRVVSPFRSVSDSLLQTGTNLR